MSLPRKQIDIQSQSFNMKNKDHIEFIHDEVNKFKVYQNQLRDYDKRTELFFGLMAGSWVLRYTTLFGTVVSSAAYLLASINFFGRSTYYQQEQDQLKSLYDIYCWCLKSSGKFITYHPDFLMLVETFAPWEDINRLKRPLNDWSDISPRFHDILLAHPQRELFVNAKPEAQGLYHYLKSFITRNDTGNKINKEDGVATFINNLFSDMRETYHFTLYGHKTDASKGVVKTLLEQCRDKIFTCQK